MMKQANQKEKKQESNTKNKTNTIPKATKSEDKYWKNTLASNNNNKLTNWNKGEADLVYNYHYDPRKDKVEYVKVGVIKADGTIELNPIDKIPVLKPLDNYKNSNTFFDINIIINSDIAILIHIPFSPKSFAIITNTIGKINIDLIAHIMFEYFGISIA